jgi:hypothetical protein
LLILNTLLLILLNPPLNPSATLKNNEGYFVEKSNRNCIRNVNVCFDLIILSKKKKVVKQMVYPIESTIKDLVTEEVLYTYGIVLNGESILPTDYSRIKLTEAIEIFAVEMIN